MSPISELLIENGISQELLTLLLFIPVMALIVSFFRYIVGLKMFGIYAPMVLAFAYVYTGIRFGIIITLAVVFATTISYSFLRKVRMHYLARIATNYSLIAFFIILFIYINALLPITITTKLHDPATLPPLAIVLIVTLSEYFVKRSVKKSYFSSMRALVETAIIAVIGWFLFSSEQFRNILLNNLWIQPIILILNFGIGKYSGLRLSEFIRFSRVTTRND